MVLLILFLYHNVSISIAKSFDGFLPQPINKVKIPNQK